MFMISINKETNITPKTIFIGLNFKFVMAVYSKYKNKRTHIILEKVKIKLNETIGNK